MNAWGASEPLLRATYYRAFLKGVSKQSDAVLGDLGLQVFAVQTGGLALTSNDLGILLDRGIGDANAYYELTYDAPNVDHPNEYHRVDVKLSEPGLVARALQGYYKQP
jgi:hypothetical protein